MGAFGSPASSIEEKIYELWIALAQWHGPYTADLVARANNCYVNYLVDPALWESDPDLALIVSDMLDVESMLELGGCLDSKLCR